VSIGKSVPNLISYLHEFFQNFSQSLAICFELFSFGEFVYSEIADSGPNLSAAARCLDRVARPDSCLDRVTPARQPPRSPCRRRQRPPRPRPDRLAHASVRRRHAPLSERVRARRRCRAAARAPPPSVLFHRCSRAAARAPPPSVLPRRQPPPTSATALAKSPTLGPPLSCAAHRSLVAVSPHRHLHAGEPPFPLRLPCAGAEPPPSRVPPRARAMRRALRGPAELGRQRRSRGPRTLRRPRPWAAPAPRTPRAAPRTVHLGRAVSA
jgi:hypothetical protein